MKKNSSILFFFLSIFVSAFLIFKPLHAQTSSAGLLPPGVQQFFDNGGNPLSSGKVYFYDVGTTTFKDIYTSSAATVPYTNPITLNAGGKPPGGSGIYGIGLYRQVVKDRNGNLIWDAVTSPTGSGGTTPTNVGDGNVVGTVLPWSGLVAPNQYVFAYGQEISRTSYTLFYDTVTLQSNVICSASSNTLTGIADTSQIPIGAPVEASLCVIAGTTVVSKTTSTVTLSNPSSVSINTVARFFPFGNGNGTTTFNVPDLRGYVLAGRNNMGGTASSSLTSTYYLNDPNGLGAAGGFQSHTQTISEMAEHTHTPTITNNLSVNVLARSNSAAGNGPDLMGNNGTGFSYNAPANITGTISGSNSNAGSSQPFTIVQPTITLNYIIKVTPDTSTSIATGVYSIGGMTGVISCGTGILCTGNIISWNGNVLAQGSTGSIQFRNSDGSFGGSPNALFISPDNLTLGAAGTPGKFDILDTSGTRIRQTASSGNPNIIWGNTSGTPAVTASLPVVLNSTTGNLTCPTCATSSLNGQALTKTNDTNVTLTLGGAATTALLSPASLTLGWTGTLAVSRGGNGVGTISANQLILGAGTSPITTLSCATSTTVVHGGSPPTCSQIVAADITTNTVTNSNLSQVGAATLKGNPTASTANVQDFTFGSLTQTISPGSTDWIPIYDNATGTIKKVNAGSIASASVAGVASVNGLTGALTLNATSGLNIVSGATTITITPDIATASNFEAGAANKLLDAAGVFTSETTTTYGTTTTFDFNTFINSKVTLTGNITTMNCSNMKASQAGTISFIQDSTGSHTAAFNTGTCSTILKFAGATFPTLTTSASAIDILSYSCRSSTYCAAALSKGYNP